MLVPDFWAEASLHGHKGRKPVTVRRHGWSNTSAAEAQAHAQARAEAALQRILAGETLPRGEARQAYNGADGMPIREEVLARHGEQVITRNAYGAQCLNSPNVLFADVDVVPRRAPGLAWVFSGLFLLVLLGLQLFAGFAPGVTLLLAVLLALLGTFWVARPLLRGWVARRDAPEQAMRARLTHFAGTHPLWNLRLYRTPAGFRVVATHRPFRADEDEVRRFFDAVQADPVYVRMCLNQHCFRARLTAKPWRIGMDAHLKPRPGVWPVAAERLPERQAWVERYEALAKDFAACHYLESIGSGHVDNQVMPVVELHDRLTRAHWQQASLA
ncbi:hypothetical protein D8I35_11870 [Corticibacter populi]|uniref:Transmembrane protein n=2 Tax=Corticibacter populi TaxID=1550736 RepID=A0A3M6QT70_9BURK|nr:hypothetical protein D8I35_11870 [Corticibacter populi]